VKINCDAVVDKDKGKLSIGVIVRDHGGRYWRRKTENKDRFHVEQSLTGQQWNLAESHHQKKEESHLTKRSLISNNSISLKKYNSSLISKLLQKNT
jgi:hypothetical protein